MRRCGFVRHSGVEPDQCGRVRRNPEPTRATMRRLFFFSMERERTPENEKAKGVKMDSGFSRNDGNPGIGGVFQQILVGGACSTTSEESHGGLSLRDCRRRICRNPAGGRSRTWAVHKNGPLQIKLDQDGKSASRQRGQNPSSAKRSHSFFSSVRADLELPHEAQFGAGALVVVELGVGLALLVHHDELGAEAESRKSPVEYGNAEDAHIVHAR